MNRGEIVDELLYEYILKEQKKTVNNPNWNNFIKKLKVGDEVVVYHMSDELCTIRKVIVPAIQSFEKSFIIKLDNNKWYKNGLEVYEVHSQYSSASEHLIELTKELNDLIGNTYIKMYHLVRSKSTNQYEDLEERIKGAYLIDEIYNHTDE